MPSGHGAEQLGHVTMFVEDHDGLLAGLRAMQGDDVARLPGLCVHFTPLDLAGDAITAQLNVRQAYWPGDHPLGIVGAPAIKIASADPRQDAADLAVRTGRGEYVAARSHLNAVGYGVRLDGPPVEFVGSASGSAHDLVGGFLADRGRGIFATTYRVRDVSAARSALTAAGAPFTQWGRHSLLLRVEAGTDMAGRIELTDED
jgi:hypothetical protein